MPRINDDLQKLEHRAKFAQHHRAWLRFDAYSRVSMALGINQMLQSMSYFIAGPVQKHRPSFALITVIGVQAIAFFLVKLDWRSMDTDESDDEGEFQRTKKKDVSSLPLIDFFAISVTNLLPPVWMVLILWLAHFIDSTDEGNLDHQGRITARVLATPIFFLHAAWLYLVRWYIAPHQHDLLPVRLRTVGYLDVFMRDAKLVHEQEEEDLEQEVEAFPQPRRRKSTRCRHNEAAMKTVVCCDSVEDLWTSHEWEEDYLASVETSGRRAKSRGRKTPEPQSPDVEAAKGHAPSECQQCLVPKRKRPRGHDHVAWLVVGRFTTVMIWLWIGGGFIHITNSLLDLEGTPKDLNGNIQDQVRRELGPPRKLLAQWPEPARFFEVTKLHCNSSSVVIGTPFNVCRSLQLFRHRRPLAQIGEFEMKAAWCEPGRCRALEKRGRQWQLRSLGEVLPESWELLAAAPAVPPIWRSPPGAAGGAAAPVLLAAWDGERVVISRLEETDRRWRLHRRFAVHPSCETLTVLRGRALEGWDLVAGTSLGCWKISAEDHGEYSAVCHDSSNLLLARLSQSASAPDLGAERRGSGSSSLKKAEDLPGSSSQVFTTTLYEQMKSKGLFKNHFPNIPPAGKSINVPLNDSAQQDLAPEIFFPLPATPVSERKFRRISHGPGEICVHHGLKDQLLPAEDFRYGIRGQKGASTEDTMKAGLLLGVAAYQNEVAESIYESRKKEPLGRPWNRGHAIKMLPEGFGNPSGEPQNGKEVIYGIHQPPDKEEHRLLYKYTHNNFNPGERIERKYRWPAETKDSRFRFGHGLGQAQEQCDGLGPKLGR
ncbi:unnamed protein product [Durusdinium trenchii]|uniref:Uncharacterized protein n=1 Tax=Durusdinium trenchii TaxID=1381693 RepID=A0ABP0KP06_9DINO